MALQVSGLKAGTESLPVAIRAAYKQVFGEISESM